jgi:Protein of unknown function (DUF3352)
MSKKSFLPGCLAVLGVGAIAAGGFYLHLRGLLPWQKFSPVDTAKVVPDEAFAASFVDTDPKAWSILAKYGTPTARDAVTQGLGEVRKGLAKDNIDYEKDIQPWLAGITFAFLPSTGSEPGFLLVAGIKDKLAAQQFADKIAKQKDQTSSETEHQGVKVTESVSKMGDKTYTAVVGDYLLFSIDRKVIAAAIDTYRGQPSFLTKPETKALLQQSLDLKNPLARIYIDDYAKMVASAMNLPPESLKQLEKIQGIIAGVGAAEGGLQLQVVAKLADNAVTTLPQPANDRLASYFPGDTLLFWNGNSLKQGWTELERQSQNDPSIQEVLRQIRGNLQMAALDADKDVFGWMDGGFAFGVIPSTQSLGGVGVGGLMVWETSDRQTANNTLDKLGQLTAYAPGITIEKTPVEGKEVTRWQSDGQTLLTHGWNDNNSLVMTLGIPFQSKPATSIAKNPTFQQAIASLPKQNLGYFYVDMEGIAKKSGGFANFPPGTLDPAALSFLESLRGITMTVTQPDKTTSRMDVLFSLKEVP